VGKSVDRRAVVKGAGALGIGALTMGSSTSTAAAPAAWETASPDALGFAPDLGEKLDAGVKSGLLRGLHGIVITRARKLVLERYYQAPDESWGRPLGNVAFTPDTLHDLRSVTKSLVGLLYGIALDRGQVPQPDAPLMAQFPEYPDIAADPQRANLKIEHALTMTLGLEWNEQVPYTDPANSEIMMETAKDKFRFVLERAVVSPPATQWNYSGGCSALIGRLIEKGTGKTLGDFAREALFDPLGISNVEWAMGADTRHSAASGLRLTPRDLARIGALVLGKGNVGGKQIVSSAWIDASVKPVAKTTDGLDYGRFWWLGEIPVAARPKPQRFVAGFGNGGQRLWLMPAVDVCCVITSGNYNAPDQWVAPARVWREIVLANVLRA
jgi:CubicO group peptidase (beta-lactamase class C family)